MKMLHEDEKANKEKEIAELNIRFEEVENENKEMKKVLLKKESELSRNSEAIQEKLIFFESKEELLEQTIQKYKREIELMNNHSYLI